MSRCRFALRFFVVCTVLLGSSVAVGAEGVAEPEGYWEGNVDAPTPSTIHGGKVIHVEDVEALLRQGKAVVIDASNAPRRPAELAPGAPWLPLPHRAIPDALWLPGVGVGTLIQEVDDFYRSRLARATGGDVDVPLVVYCHEKCWLSWNAAKRAIGYGYRRVLWFPEGLEGWIAAGQQTAVAAPQGPASAEQAPVATAGNDGRLPALAILDLELTGDLGGPEFEAEHAARLKTMSARLRQDLERTGMYRILDNSAAQSMIDTLRSQQSYLHDCNGCDLDVGHALHADLVFVAWVDRVSGLILSLTYEIHEVQTGQIAARKSFDFRGDNDNAWNHAIDYMVRDLAKK
jgi:PQQ-dependent catabolism-associated CXXCW motif protein